MVVDKRGTTTDRSPPCDNSSMSTNTSVLCQCPHSTSIITQVFAMIPQTLMAAKMCFYALFFLSISHLPPSTYRHNYLSLADSPLSTTALERRHYEREMGQLMIVEEGEKQERAWGREHNVPSLATRILRKQFQEILDHFLRRAQ